MENKTYTEEDLRLAFRAGNHYGQLVAHNPSTNADDEDEYIQSLAKETKTEEKEIPITYGLIKATCGWSKFAETCNRNVYAINEFGDYEDREVFYITESQAKQLNFI